MKAEKFIEVWKEFVGGDFLKGETWQEAWLEKNKPWTPRVLGEAHASEKDSPLGDHLVKNLGKSWRYRTEEWKVDLVVAKTDSNWKAPTGWENYWKGLFWPSTYEILVEHEASCGKSYEEMAKLILLRSRLKVLITYTADAGRKDSSSLITETRKQFEAMIRAASESLLEPEDVRYVLVVGRLEGKGQEAVPKWYSSIFSAAGDVLHNDPIPSDGA